MIDKAIELGRFKTAIKMEFVLMAYQENGDIDSAFERMLALQKGDLIWKLKEK